MLEPAIVKYRRLDGSAIEVEAVATNLTIKGRPAVLGVLRDLAWRRRVERQLRDERQRFQTLVEGVRDYAIYMLDVDGRITSWNPGASRTTGYSADEILGEPMAAFYTPEDRLARVPERMLERAAAEGSCEHEGQRVRKDGSRFWGSTLVSHLLDEKGGARGFAVLTRDVSERRRAEDALRESETRFRSLAETSSVGIWRNGPDSECTYLNRRACELIDLPLDQALGHGWAQALHPEDRDRIMGEWRQFAAGGEHFRSEYRFVHRNGRVINVIGEAIPERVGGQVVGYVGTLTDITDLVEAEVELRRSEARYRYFFENSPAPMWLYDVATLEILDANQATVDSLGYPREELLEMTIAEIRPAEDVDALRSLIASLGTGVNYAGVWRHRRKGGAVVDFQIISHGFDFEGRAARLVFAFDLTERIDSERKVRESESRLSAVIESAMDAIITIDEHQRIVLFNDAAERMFGWTDAGMIGEPLDSLLPERFRLRHGGHIRQFSMTKVTNRRMGALGTLFGLRKNGEEFPIEASISQVALEGRRLFTVILRDVTERERAERALREARQRTEQLSRRIIDVQEQERNHLARELHDEIGQVLTAVRINLQGLLRTAADTATEDLVVETIDVTAQALEKVRGLSLDLRPAQLDDFGLGAALDWHLKRQATTAGLKVELDLRLPDRRLPPDIEIACFRVVQEALTNVVRHAKARTVKVSVWCESEALRASIIDDGCGFETDRTLREAAAGRSFGLMGMEERAALLGGRLELDSAPGRGTTVSAWFPFELHEGA
jgi:PAS domain S-box-containing protein